MAEEVFRPPEYKIHEYSDVDPPTEHDAQTICVQHLPIAATQMHLPNRRAL
ncbi:hypothetical protein E8E11_007306 [Didymella keratinophila]|nr:hypothetical protein E8E11_007306 [Didymella keratinophila]